MRTNAERQEKFLTGLDDELTNQLISGDYADFEKLVGKTIRQEDQCNKMDRKRKAAQFRAHQGGQQKPHFGSEQQGGPSTMIVRQHRPYHPDNFSSSSGGNNIIGGLHNRTITPRPPMAQPQTPQLQQQKKKSGGKPLIYYNCNELGHFADKCPKPKHNGPKIVQARVNHVCVEEA